MISSVEKRKGWEWDSVLFGKAHVLIKQVLKISTIHAANLSQHFIYAYFYLKMDAKNPHNYKKWGNFPVVGLHCDSLD